MRTAFALATLLLASPAAALIFKAHGKVVRSLAVPELTRFAAPKTITIWEPHEKTLVKFKAYAVDELFSAIYGPDWKKSEDALFTCVDGYQPSIPVPQFSAHRGYLAFARDPDRPFTVLSPDTHAKVQMGPLYLVWDNVTDESIRMQGTIPGWPYQITTIDLIQFSDRFPHMAPAPGSPEAARRGFAGFRKRCLSCHTVNGEGGAKGVELNYPANPTEYWNEAWLKRWIEDPKSVRYNTEMHAFHRDGTRWREDLDDVLAYLKAMAANKHRPANAAESAPR